MDGLVSTEEADQLVRIIVEVEVAVGAGELIWTTEHGMRLAEKLIAHGWTPPEGEGMI